MLKKEKGGKESLFGGIAIEYIDKVVESQEIEKIGRNIGPRNVAKLSLGSLQNKELEATYHDQHCA